MRGLILLAVAQRRLHIAAQERCGLRKGFVRLLPECAVTSLGKLRGEHQPFEPDRALRIAVLEFRDECLAIRELFRRDQRQAVFVPEVRLLREFLRRFLAPLHRARVIAARRIDLREQRDGVRIVRRIERELIGLRLRVVEFALGDEQPA